MNPVNILIWDSSKAVAEARMFPAFDMERPMPLGELQERFEGPQIARWMQQIRLPKGWTGFGAEFTNGERWIVGAAPLQSPPFNARIFLRVFDAEKLIWTKRLRKRLRSDRGQQEPEPDPLIREIQHRVDGEVIRAFRRIKTPTERGGERVIMEFLSGAEFELEAVRIGLEAAELEYALEPAGARLLFTP